MATATRIHSGYTPSCKFSSNSRRFDSKLTPHFWSPAPTRLVQKFPQRTGRFFVKALAAKKGGNSGDKARRYDPLFAKGGITTDCPVPWDQQPVNEYQNLNETGLFPWATDDVRSFSIRLAVVGVGISAFIGYPIASLSINPQQEILKCWMGAVCGGILASTVVTLRLYLGWAYIGNRLFSATVECYLHGLYRELSTVGFSILWYVWLIYFGNYNLKWKPLYPADEETGWYDGEVWVKPPEVLARDRLLGSYKVKPALLRLKLTLVGLAISLAALTGVMFVLPGPEIISSTSVEDTQESLSKSSGLKYDDGAAHRYEPEAFIGEDDLPIASAATLFDYCH